MSILIFLLVLFVLILVHEFGHFITAKALGIRVDEFGIGFPPKIFGKKFGETEYTVNALPFGGFVKIFGEDPDEDTNVVVESLRNFSKKPKLAQASVLVAGVFFNILLAWFLFSAGFLIGLPLSTTDLPEGARVSQITLVAVDILPNSPAEKGGIQPGDTIQSVTSGEDTLTAPNPSDFKMFVDRHGGEELSISLKRAAEEKILVVTPEKGVVPGGYAIGIAMDTIGKVTLPPGRALSEGAHMTYLFTKETAKGLGRFLYTSVRGQGDLSQVAGPVGIVGMVGAASDMGLTYLLGFVALISINLAIINILPFPALDGGRLLFLVIETVKGSPIRPRIVNALNTAGFAFLILLILFVTYHDIVRLFVE